MKAQFKMLCYLFFGSLAILGQACAPGSTAKPVSSLPSGADSARTANSDRAGEGQRGKTGESSTDASSLKQLQEGKAPITPASSPLKDVFFDFDRYDLSGEARSVLRTNADWLKSNTSARVEIEGHCDDRGTNEYNLALGAKRAQAARDYLGSLGITSERLSTISYGEEIPVCREQQESCWKQNRRARFVIQQGKPTS
ncbi:MAG TPA: peptidoglycan-associated lipoprotein Pal [Candidatus Binatus sp.]|nr:peptidoglycan-associated lipoprotein Pal [Candidatus Binatus sp.]